jgi:hypothetical protein
LGVGITAKYFLMMLGEIWLKRLSYEDALENLANSKRERVNALIIGDLKDYLTALQLNMEHRLDEKMKALEILTKLRERIQERIKRKKDFEAEFIFDCLFLGPLVKILHLRLQFIQITYNQEAVIEFLKRDFIKYLDEVCVNQGKLEQKLRDTYLMEFEFNIMYEGI